MPPKYKQDGLPRCVYFKNGAYWYVKNNQWRRLGKTLAEMYRGLARETIEAPGSNTVNEVIRRYRDEIIPGKAEATQKQHIKYLEVWAVAIGHMPPDQVRPKHIAQVHDHLGQKAAVSANRALEVIRHVFTKARRWGYRDDNPASKIERHPERPRDREVTQDEYLAVYELALPAMQVAMELARITGLRQGDILALKWSQITDDGIYNKAAKNKSKLDFAMNWSLKLTLDEAKRLLGDAISHYVVPSRKGGGYKSAGFQSNWGRLMDKAVKECGIERFTFHDIRSMAADQKESDKAAAELLGNTEAATRKHYRRKARTVHPNV